MVCLTDEPAGPAAVARRESVPGRASAMAETTVGLPATARLRSSSP